MESCFVYSRMQLCLCNKCKASIFFCFCFFNVTDIKIVIPKMVSNTKSIGNMHVNVKNIKDVGDSIIAQSKFICKKVCGHFFNES